VLVRSGRDGAAFAATSATMAAVVVSIFTELYPRVMVSSLGAANDLTVSGSAASSYALRVMTVVLVVLLPVVLAYQGWTYHVFRNRLSGAETRGDGDEPTPPPRTAAASSESRARRRGETATWPSTPSSRPLTRLVWWLLAWVIAWLIARLMAAAAPAAHGAGGSGAGPDRQR
jgi:bd-type cytochrome oxidase subunit II